MQLVYIAGPYRAPTIRGVVENIQRAEKVAIRYWQYGCAVICPHKNTALMDGSVNDNDHDVWLKGDLEMLKRCDVIVMMNDWQSSEGAKAEHEFAKENGIEIVYD